MVIVLPDIVMDVVRRNEDGIKEFFRWKRIPSTLDSGGGLGTDAVLFGLLETLCEVFGLPHFKVSFPEEMDPSSFAREKRVDVERTVRGVQDQPFFSFTDKSSCAASHDCIPEWPCGLPRTSSGTELHRDQLRGVLLDFFDYEWPAGMRFLLRLVLSCTYLLKIVELLDHCDYGNHWENGDSVGIVHGPVDMCNDICRLREETLVTLQRTCSILLPD